MRDPRVFQPCPRRGAAFRLFCFHPAGYGAAMYREWGKVVSPKVEVCAVRLPGRENLLAEAPLDDFTAIVDWICAAIEPLLDRPYAVFGHSMGAWVGFETVRQLNRAGYGTAVQLFASSRHAPQLATGSMDPTVLDDADLIADLQRQYQGIPAAVLAQPELLQMMLPILRSDLAALNSYEYVDSGPIACPITCYAGLDDPEVRDEHLQAWSTLTSQRFEVKRFPGSHWYVSSAARDDLLRHMHSSLEAVQRQSRRLATPSASNR